MTQAQLPLLEVKNLTKHYKTNTGIFNKSKSIVHAVDNVSFSLLSGKTLGLVGESGSGKSTLGKTILKLIDKSSGEIFFNGSNISDLNETQFRPYRREMQVIFQDRFANLNPKFSVLQILSEPFEIHGLVPNKKERIHIIQELLKEVGINPNDIYKYPHEFSGGQKQRIGIARSIALKPKLIVCDEPVSALDVSIQSQILNLLMDLRDKYSLSFLFIAHNLAVVEQISDEVAVMHLGEIVEIAPVEQLFKNPLHPYTQALIASVPKLDVNKRKRVTIMGDIPSPLNPPDGCRFNTRCPFARNICKTIAPQLKSLDSAINHNHLVACHFAGQNGINPDNVK